MTQKKDSQPSPPPKATQAKSPRPSNPFDRAMDAGISRSDSAGKIRKSIPIGDSAPTPLTVSSAAPPPPLPPGKSKK